ncbi:MAG: hypothetical protein QOI84_314 [Solirubrobacterales bacterium]|jgi:hypothetical protein|nr:hypothetical protein [Solirubrobacterales bacterium]
MDAPEGRDLERRKALRILDARRRRVNRLRWRVVTMSLVCFALFWGVVSIQMATGNDPVLSQKTRSSGTGSREPSERTSERTETPEGGTDLEAEAEAIEAEIAEEESAAPIIEPEPIEPEPLTTGQS